jgi:hypothetical protein
MMLAPGLGRYSMDCTECGQQDSSDKPHYCVNCGSRLGPGLKIRYGKNRIEIEDENGAVTVEHYKSRKERNEILARFGQEGVDFREVNIPNPFPWLIKRFFGKY